MRGFLGVGWLWCAALVACGSSGTKRAETDPPPPSDTLSREEVLEACGSFAQAYCVSMADCCNAVHQGHDADACQAAFESAVCVPGADAVAAGRADFDADAVEPCLAAYARAFDTCQADWDEILELRADIYRACRVIDGHTEAGDGCQTSVLCRRPPGAGTSACVEGVCTEIHVLSEGDECPFPSGDVSVCDSGLHCTSPGLEEVGTCAPALALGESCDPNEATNVCGLGRYCARGTETCQVSDNFGGPTCEQHGECVSFSCDQTSNECAPAAVVPRSTCLGQ